MNLTDSERDSLRKILRGVHLSDYGSRIVADAQLILAKLIAAERETTFIVLDVKRCTRCGRQQSKSAGCPDRCRPVGKVTRNG